MGGEQIKIENHYDPESDILYISLSDNEPTYTESIDDISYLEIGWFSGMPKGFRIMSPRARQINKVTIGLILKQWKKVVENRCKELMHEEDIFGDMINRNLPEILQVQA